MDNCIKDKSTSPPPLSRGLSRPRKKTPDGCKQTLPQQLGGLGDVHDQEVPTKSPELDDFRMWMADGVTSLRQQCVTSYCIIQEIDPRKKGFNRSRVQRRAVKHRKLEEPLPLSQKKAMTTELLNSSATAPSVQLPEPVMQLEQMRSTTAFLMGCDMSFDSDRFSTGSPNKTYQLPSSQEQAEENEWNPLQGEHFEQAIPPDHFSSTGSQQGHYFTTDQFDRGKPAEGNPLTYPGEALRIQKQHSNGDVFYPHVELAPTDNTHTLSRHAISPSALKYCLPWHAEAELGARPKEQGHYVVAGNSNFINVEEICDADQLAGSLMMPISCHVRQDTMRAPIPARCRLKKHVGWTCVDASQGDDLGNDIQDQPGGQMEWEGETRQTKNLGPTFTDQSVRLQENIKGNDVQEKEQLEAGELMEVKMSLITHSEKPMCENVIRLDATPVKKVTTSEEKESLSCGTILALSFETTPTSNVLKLQIVPATNSQPLLGDIVASSDTNSTKQDRLVSVSESTFQNPPPSRILETEIGPVLNSEPMLSDRAISSDTTPVESKQKSEEQDSLISGSESATSLQAPISPRILENAVQQSEYTAAEPLEKNASLLSLQDSSSTILLEVSSEGIEQRAVEQLEKNNLVHSRLLEVTSPQEQIETQRENKSKSQLQSLLPRIRKNSRSLGKYALRYLEHIEHQLVSSALPHKLSHDNCDSPQPAESICDQRSDSGLASYSPAWRDRERQQLHEKKHDWEGERCEDVGVESDVAVKPGHDLSWTDVVKLADSSASEELRQDVATPLSGSSTSSLLEIFSTTMSISEAFDQLEVVVENLLGLLNAPNECSVSNNPSCETMSSDDNVDRSRSGVLTESVCFLCVHTASSADVFHDLSGDDVLEENVSFSNENVSSSVDGLHNRVEASASYLLSENACSIDENMASPFSDEHDNNDCSGSEIQVAYSEENTASSPCFSDTANLNSN